VHAVLAAKRLGGCLALALLLELLNDGLLIAYHLLLLLYLEFQEVVFLLQVKHALRKLVKLLRVQVLSPP